jgi:leader peptidase (prepilin peptidase) / N-methyltransferase
MTGPLFLSMQLLNFIYAFFGLIVGSFLNVCIYRIPRDQSIALPRSRCPHCGKPVRPYDNVPVLSYILLGGRCRDCRGPISPQYPIVELLTGLAFYLCALKWEFGPPTYLNSAFLSAIAVLVFIDYSHQILPNVITIPGALVGIALSPFQAEEHFRDLLSFSVASALYPGAPYTALPWVGSILGALLGGGILFLVAFLYQRVRKRQGLGMGDVKMMTMVGAFLGWRLALLTIFAGSLLGSVIGIFLILFRGKNLQSKLAFGTFLGIGCAVSLFLGLAFIDWYAGLR